eukprot:tig00021127_g18860.t1
MIKAILIINNHGKPRVLKFYERISDAEQQAVIRWCHSVVTKRSDRVCNFVEIGQDAGGTDFGKDTKLVYRHYATLYFIFLVDTAESELGILDLIQVFVETLDKIFANVCELDLIFHSEKVHFVLDEIIMGGMVLETNVAEVLQAVDSMNKLDSAGSFKMFKR